MRYVAVDVETAQACDHVIEIALVEIVGGAMTGREHVGRFRPRSAMNPFCQRVHGISLSDLASEPYFSDSIRDIVRFVGDSTMVAHNRATEERTLAKEFGRAGLVPWGAERFLCTMRMAKDAGLPGGLRLAAAGLDIPTGHMGRNHSALEDTRLCAEMFIRLHAPVRDARPHA